MKKSLLVFSLSMMSLAVLAGCNSSKTSSTPASVTPTTSETPTSTSTPTSASDTPAFTVSDGKTGFAVKITWEGVTCPTYCSIYMTGCMAQVKGTDGKITATWKTGLDAIEMKPVSGHDGWYYGESDVYSTADYKANLGTGVTDQNNEYALVVGYNKTAEISSTKQGLQWVDAYKAAYCASFAYPANAKFDGEGGAKKVVTLHEDKFTAVPKKPEAPLTNYTIKVKFSAALPTWEVPHLFGSFDSWNTVWSKEAEAAHCMTAADSARQIWTYKFDSIIPDSYDITMSLDYTMAAMPDQTSYAWNKPDDWSKNLKYSVQSNDGNDFVMKDEDALTADLTNAGVLPDPTIKYDYVFKLINTGTAVAGDVYLSGAFTAWEQTAATKMTVDSTGLIYTFSGVNHVAGTVKFRFLVGASWDHAVASTENGDDSNNFVYKLPAKSGTVTLSADMTNVLTKNVQLAPDSFVFTAA